MNKLQFLFVVSIKWMVIVQVIDWRLLLEPIKVIYSLHIQLTKTSNPFFFQVIPIICDKVSLCSLCIFKYKKNRCIKNAFLWPIYNAWYAFIWACVFNRVSLSENVFGLKWVGSDKILESILQSKDYLCSSKWPLVRLVGS